MTGAERVAAALDFREPDRVPHFNYYWGAFAERWRRLRGLPTDPAREQDDIADDPELDAYYDIDLYVAIADETPWPRRAQLVTRDGEHILRRDGWGRLIHERVGARFYETLELPLADKAALDRLLFDAPEAGERYTGFLQQIALRRAQPSPPYIFAKVGGPYLRSSFLRGEAEWLMDLASDPGFVDALATRVADHLIAVGIESLRRGGLDAIAIYDDIAGNHGLLMGPRLYRRYFLPQMARMVVAFKRGGARKVMFHSDGDIRAVLDDLVDVGIDAINPIEPRAGMDVVALREKYGRRLALVGGLCNSRILPQGTPDEVRCHILHVLQAGRGGGLVIGAHSIGPDISQERYDEAMALLRRYWHYPLRQTD